MEDQAELGPSHDGSFWYATLGIVVYSISLYALYTTSTYYGMRLLQVPLFVPTGLLAAVPASSFAAPAQRSVHCPVSFLSSSAVFRDCFGRTRSSACSVSLLLPCSTRYQRMPTICEDKSTNLFDIVPGADIDHDVLDIRQSSWNV